MPDNFSTKITKLSRLIRHEIRHSNEHNTQQEEGGPLTLSGPACLIETEGSSDNRRTVKAVWTPDDERSVEDHDSDDGWFGKSTVIFDTMEELVDVLFCLWMVTQPLASGGWQASGLALRCVIGSTYRRIGTVSCYYADKASLDGFIEEFPHRVVKIC